MVRIFKSQMSTFLVKYTALALLTAFLFSSCMKSNNEEPELQSAVNIVNASIGMPQISFYINRTKVQGAPLQYTNESGYFITFPGNRDFDVSAEGITDFILKTNFAFKENTYHTVYIVGENSSISALFTEDDLRSPPTGKAKLRFVNLSPDSGNLTLGVKNGTDLFPDQAYKSASQFITVDPGGYDLQLKTGTGTVLLDKNVAIAAGSVYTVWVNGLRAGTSNSPIGLQFRAIN